MSDSSTNKVAILVAGMHRSGTSALTRILNIVGCDLPKTLMNPKRYRGNEGGFWESQAIMDLNQEILASAGSSWDDWRPFDQDWYRSPLVDEFRERARQLIRSEFGNSRLFVLKDPRICRLMGIWVEAVRALGARPLVVSPIRNPLDVAASLQVRDHIDPSVGHLIWLRHTLDAEADSRGLKRAYLRYEYLLSDAMMVVDTLGNELGVSWPRRSSPDTETKIAEFLSPELYHHRSEDASLLSNPSLSNWVNDSFEIFDRWTRDEVRKEDAPNLDRTKAAFDGATPVLGHALAAGQQEKERNRTLSDELDSFRRVVTNRGGRIETLLRKVAKCENRIEAQRRELATLRQVVAHGEGTDRDTSGPGSDTQADCESAVFQTLDTDLCEGLGVQPGEMKRVCIATPDILGPVKNESIGTAYYHMARFLAEQGHDVVIAYVNHNASNAGLMEETRAFYAGFGVAFQPIVPRPASKNMLAQVAAPTWALLDWLRARERGFDLVHVSEWQGLGYGPLLAKLQGLAFGATHFVVKGSSPTLWQVEGNRQLLSTEQELGWVFMERRSVELADTVICGSVHLLEWMRDAGYALPARSFVWPNVFPAPDPSPEAATERVARGGARLDEVVFFGRLEPRKGLTLFIDAIDRLVRRGRAPARVTFLGGTFLGALSRRFNGLRHIQDRARRWPITVHTITDFGAEEAVAYLSQPGRLAVIPSLLENSSIAVMECLQAGIPFLAAATGGTPELVGPEDHGRALVAADPIALGERIADLASVPLRAVRPRWDFDRTLEVWSRWHAQTKPFEAAVETYAKKACLAGSGTPLVTVCIVHHERPELVRMAVDSVLAQDYPALEAVLVDDGSESAEALAGLDALEAEFGERGWRVLRQENRYLGAARNAAAATAQGEWLLFLDDDNVLFPDAVSRLVRAARFSGVDCVPAASVRFFGDGDPRTDSGSHRTPIRFLGTARAWSRFRNAVGDACALVRREVFEAVGGFDEERGFATSDLSFFNRLVVAGHRVEPMPDPAYYYRTRPTSMMSVMSDRRLAEINYARVLASHVQGLPDEERAFCSFAIDRTINAPAEWVTRRAEVAMHRRDWTAASVLWAELRGAFPDDTSGYLRGAEALRSAGRVDEAEGLACEAVERFPDRPEGYVQRGEAAMRRGDWALASERWGELRHVFPDHVLGYLRGAAALLSAGRVDEAEGLACEAVERFPDRPEGYVQRGEAAMRRGNWAWASERWAGLRQVFPDHVLGYVRGAAALLNAGRVDEAEGLACEAVERFPDRPEGYVQRGEAAMRRGDWTAASERWGELRQVFPGHVLGYTRGAEALRSAGRLDEAEGLACEAVERFPDRPEGYVQRGEAAMRRGDWTAASERWGELRQVFPGHVLGYTRGAEALRSAGRLDEAEGLACEAVKRFPNRPEGYVQRGEVAMRRGDWALASERWGELRQVFPDHVLGYARGAEALRSAGRVDEAEGLACEAVKRFPDRTEGYVQRGEVAMRRGDWTAASERWGELRQVFPDHVLGYTRGAEALRSAGRLDEAEGLACEAVKRFPDGPGGRVQRAEAAMRRGDWALASENGRTDI